MFDFDNSNLYARHIWMCCVECLKICYINQHRFSMYEQEGYSLKCILKVKPYSIYSMRGQVTLLFFSFRWLNHQPPVMNLRMGSQIVNSSDRTGLDRAQLWT